MTLPVLLLITPVKIGPKQAYEDPYGTWADLREIEDGGVLLIRPDLYVAARQLAAPASEVATTDSEIPPTATTAPTHRTKAALCADSRF